MKEKRYSPIVLSGPSGSGKSDLIDYIEKKNPLFLEATGSTTRAKRENETGRMNFLTKERFNELILSDNLIEYCIYNGNYYGVSKEEFLKLRSYHLIFNVGYSSAKIIKKEYDDTFMIYLLSPTKEELLRRMGSRDLERYKLGIEETMKNAFNYEYLLLSLTNDLESTYYDFMDIISQNDKANQKRLTLSKNIDFINNFYK